MKYLGILIPLLPLSVVALVAWHERRKLVKQREANAKRLAEFEALCERAREEHRRTHEL